MIILGVVLLIVAFVVHSLVAGVVGVLLLVLGVVFAILGALGRLVFGRRHFF